MLDHHIIHTWRDPFGMGFPICDARDIKISPGLTVLVGCNGSGKTTMLDNIASQLQEENIPCHRFNNLREGHNSNTIGEAIFNHDIAYIADSWTASEGENITLVLQRQLEKLDEFMITGRIKSRTNSLIETLSGSEYETPNTSERWILFDAVDSGYSIDNIIDLKKVFNALIQKFKEHGYDLYIVISANEFELAYESPCLDVTTGKYYTFTTYPYFKEFILETRRKKERRYQRAAAKQENEESE